MIQILLPQLGKASLIEIHQAALKLNLTDLAERSAFCRYYDVAQVIRKHFVLEGLVRIDLGKDYVWLDPNPQLAATPEPSEPEVVAEDVVEDEPEPIEEPEEDEPTEIPSVAAGPDTDEDEPEGDVEGNALEGMSKDELIELARERGVKYSGLNKSELIEALSE